MIISFTGHRPDRLGGYVTPNPLYTKIVSNMRYVIEGLGAKLIYVGGAQGVDTWAAELAIEMKIPFILAIPCENQEALWPKAAKEKYHSILEKAKEVILVCSGPYSAEKMFIRNRFLVDKADTLVAIFDGSKSGTMNCVNYAKKMKKTIITINPKEL